MYVMYVCNNYFGVAVRCYELKKKNIYSLITKQITYEFADLKLSRTLRHEFERPGAQNLGIDGPY